MTEKKNWEKRKMELRINTMILQSDKQVIPICHYDYMLLVYIYF